jgi:cytochrome o ubiquinol oxidase subunit IV
MNKDEIAGNAQVERDRAPGPDLEIGEALEAGLQTYLIGFVLAVWLTGASFWVAQTHAIYSPAIPAALVALAVAQMGVHLVFFLHITTGPDNTNNVLALAFGILIVCLVIFGSLWIMAHLNHGMLPMKDMLNMQH